MLFWSFFTFFYVIIVNPLNEVIVIIVTSHDDAIVIIVTPRDDALVIIVTSCNDALVIIVTSCNDALVIITPCDDYLPAALIKIFATMWSTCQVHFINVRMFM